MVVYHSSGVDILCNKCNPLTPFPLPPLSPVENIYADTAQGENMYTSRALRSPGVGRGAMIGKGCGTLAGRIGAKSIRVF